MAGQRLLLDEFSSAGARRAPNARPRLRMQDTSTMERPMAKLYRVYSIIERPKQDDYWLNIGVAFPHEDGEGFNVLLQALPLHGGGKIVLRAYEPEKEETSSRPE